MQIPPGTPLGVHTDLALPGHPGALRENPAAGTQRQTQADHCHRPCTSQSATVNRRLQRAVSGVPVFVLYSAELGARREQVRPVDMQCSSLCVSKGSYQSPHPPQVDIDCIWVSRYILSQEGESACNRAADV